MRSSLIALLALLAAVPAMAQTYDIGFVDPDTGQRIDALVVDISTLPGYNSINMTLTPSEAGQILYKWSLSPTGPWTTIEEHCVTPEPVCIQAPNPGSCTGSCSVSFWYYPGDVWPDTIYVKGSFTADDGSPTNLQSDVISITVEE